MIKKKKIECDTIILACGYSSNNEIAEELESIGMEYKLIGDSVKSRKILNAVHEGFHTARLLFEEI